MWLLEDASNRLSPYRAMGGGSQKFATAENHNYKPKKTAVKGKLSWTELNYFYF